MERIKLLIDYHLSDLKTISDLSFWLRLAPETLRKRFLRDENISIGEYIIRRKVMAMKERLLISDDPCYLICIEFGFREDTGARMFKKYAGMTMNEYRSSQKPGYSCTEEPEYHAQ
ncbi:MAG: AraC family transcriptional regulator [Bacteroidota bacterium]